MPKIRELINFEPIKEVIDIDAISNSKEMVENYVISPSLEEHLVHVFRDLQKEHPQSASDSGGVWLWQVPYACLYYLYFKAAGANPLYSKREGPGSRCRDTKRLCRGALGAAA